MLCYLSIGGLNTQTETKQITFRVLKELKRAFDQVIAELTADCLKAGLEPPSKKEIYATAFIQWWRTNLGRRETMEWAKRKIVLQRLIDDVKETMNQRAKQILEEFLSEDVIVASMKKTPEVKA